MLTDPYASGVLTRERHARLVANIDNFAADAGIQPFWLTRRMSDVCSPLELEFVRRLPFLCDENGKFSFAYVGSDAVNPVETRMAAMAACLLRNFRRARVMHLGHVLDIIAEGETPQARILLIPNFFLAAEEGGEVRPWLKMGLLDLLYQRQAKGLPTVIAISSLKMLEKQYGSQFRAFIDNHYQTLTL